ncbi:MAG TPA: zf-HC2 domain-containing protein [Vicinamibacterales bacterium]|nr:zf-HC2 domain-containing protein [Vicinamibacterales bacterium]
MMHEHPCADVRERLEAFYDGELSLEQRVAIQNHLGECVTCSVAAEELTLMGATLREFAAQVADRTSDEPIRMSARVIERLRVEEQFSLKAQVMSLFQDMHLVWAGLGATVATMICVIGSASVLHAANQQQPGSFANVIAILANPGSNENPMRLNYEMMAPRAVSAAPIDMTEEDGEYALSAVVSREGRVQGVEVLNQSRVPGRSMNALLHDAYRVQFSPAQARGDAVAVSVVWLVANTTVKGRGGEDIEALRQALRAQTTPQPIGPLPVPADALPKPAPPAPLLKPTGPDAPQLFAAGG